VAAASRPGRGCASAPRRRRGGSQRRSPRAPDWEYDAVNLEGEFAFAATKVSGEWVYDEFHAPTQTHVARGWTLQGRQTLTPRVFAHSRMSTVDSPAAVGRTFIRRNYWSVDSTVGYLVNPEVTVRVGHAAMKTFTRTDVDHQVGVSIIWSRRWW
jgi:hypothetical protein